MENRPAFSTGPGSGPEDAAAGAGSLASAPAAGAATGVGAGAGAGSGVLEGMADQLRVLSREAAAGTAGIVEASEAALFAFRIEELSRTVEHLQVVAAGRLEQVRTDAESEGKTTSWVSPDGRRQQEYRHTADYLRQALRIGRSEATKRVKLAATLLPSSGMTGAPVPPAHEYLAEAMADGEVPAKSATTVSMALRKAKPLADPATLEKMEVSLATTAAEHDPDFVNAAATRWLNLIDQDGAEPSEEVLHHRQGIFTRRKKAGLHHLEIFATDDQYEHLITTVNAAANPKARGCGPEDPEPATGTNNATGAGATGTGTADGAGALIDVPAGGASSAYSTAADDVAADPAARTADAAGGGGVLDRRTRPQKLLDGLVAACKVAMATGGMPDTGGQRPQVMAVIDYQDLLNDLTGATDSGTGSYIFGGPVTAGNIRQLACDAEIMPVILSGEGRILDAGTGQRLFPPGLRKALIARDGGCAFPGCTVPAAWCEAHHILYWSKHGPTTTDNGVLQCGHHHHVVHKEKWRIEIRNGVPWFIPPTYIDPYQKPLRNHYFNRRAHLAEKTGTPEWSSPPDRPKMTESSSPSNMSATHGWPQPSGPDQQRHQDLSAQMDALFDRTPTT